MSQDITALVLAAGSAQRMKMPKLFLDFQGAPLLAWCLRAIQKARLTNIVLVVGKAYEDAFSYLSLMPETKGVDIVINHDFARGMSSSLRLGLEVMPSESLAMLLFLADMPFLTEKIIHEIIASWEKENTKIIVPCYQGQRGHPVLIPRLYFEELKEVTGDRGAKDLLKKIPGEGSFSGSG